MKRIGVLALQGDFAEHLAVLKQLGVETQEVRLPEHLRGLDGLILPGGESTTQARLMDVYELREPIKEMVGAGMAAWGTCAGLILLARKLVEDRPEPLGLMDIEVQRNAYGRQVDSFEADIPVAVLRAPDFHAIFIRAPKIARVGRGVKALASHPEGGTVAVQEGRLLATAFHPELTHDPRFHKHFIEMADDG